MSDDLDFIKEISEKYLINLEDLKSGELQDVKFYIKNNKNKKFNIIQTELDTIVKLSKFKQKFGIDLKVKYPREISEKILGIYENLLFKGYTENEIKKVILETIEEYDKNKTIKEIKQKIEYKPTYPEVDVKFEEFKKHSFDINKKPSNIRPIVKSSDEDEKRIFIKKFFKEKKIPYEFKYNGDVDELYEFIKYVFQLNQKEEYDKNLPTVNLIYRENIENYIAEMNLESMKMEELLYELKRKDREKFIKELYPDVDVPSLKTETKEVEFAEVFKEGDNDFENIKIQTKNPPYKLTPIIIIILLVIGLTILLLSYIFLVLFYCWRYEKRQEKWSKRRFFINFLIGPYTIINFWVNYGI